MAEVFPNPRSNVIDEIELITEALRDNSERLRVRQDDFLRLENERRTGVFVMVASIVVGALVSGGILVSANFLEAWQPYRWVLSGGAACVALISLVYLETRASRLRLQERIERTNVEQLLHVVREIAQRASQLEHRANIDETRKLILQLELAQAEGILRRSKFMFGISPDDFVHRIAPVARTQA